MEDITEIVWTVLSGLKLRLCKVSGDFIYFYFLKGEAVKR